MNIKPKKFYYKVDRCLARYCPRSEANNGAVQYHTIQCNTMQYNEVPYNTMQCQYHMMQCNAMQYHTIQCSIMQYQAMPYSAIPYSAMPYSVQNTHTNKTLPEAQRTQKLTPRLGLNLATT